jgi:amino acid transporter
VNKEKIVLKRELGLPLVVFYGLGNILGAGIYVLVGKVAGEAGMLAPLAFFVACLVAAVTAFTYAELTARFPLSAGEAVYVQQGFAKVSLSVLAGLLISLAGLVSAATIVLGFVGYLQVFVDIPVWVGAVGLSLVLGAVAAWGIGKAVLIAALLTILEIIGLVIIIFVGWDQLGSLPERWSELIPSQGFVQWQGVFVGAFLAFYAFLGFEDMVNVAEEVKKPERNLPLAIVIALVLSTILYFLVSLVAVLTVAPSQLAESNAPLATVYEVATGKSPQLITIISLFAVVNGALIQMIMVSRIFYGMSSQGWLPDWLGYVHPKTHTPVIATALVTLAVLILALWLPLVALAKATSFFILIVFALVHIALWRIKRSQPLPQGVRPVPMWMPVLGVILTLGLIGVELFF